jgi:hypothetical protein
VARVSDRLRYITRIIREQGERDVISLRRDDVVWLIGTVVQLRDDNEYHEKRMKMYEKRAIRLAAENDLLKVSLKQADSKRAAEIINDHFKGGEW